MTALFRIGERRLYYFKKRDVTVVAEVIEPANRRGQVKIKVLESLVRALEGEERRVPESWLLRGGGQLRSFLGGEQTWEGALQEIRDRVLRRLAHDLQPVKSSQNPRKELYFRYNPRWVAFHIWLHPRHLELKLTLEIKDKAKRKRAYELLRSRQSQIEAALGQVHFNWRATPPRTVFEEITWPGEEGPRPADIDQAVERLTLYITTLQPMLSTL
jgi:hypothetical protein